MADETQGPLTRSIHAGAVAGEDVVPPLRRSVITRFDTAERFGRVMDGEEEGFLYGRLGSTRRSRRGRDRGAGGLAEAGSDRLRHGRRARRLVALVPNGGRLVVALQTYGNTISLFRDQVGRAST